MNKWILDLIEREHYCNFITKNNNSKYPLIRKMPYFFENGIFSLTQSVLFPQQLKDIENNNQVALFIKNSDNLNAILVEGEAYIDESDLSHKWMEFKDQWFEIDKRISNLYKTEIYIPHFWKRAIIKIKPSKLDFWNDFNSYTEKIEILMELL